MCSTVSCASLYLCPVALQSRSLRSKRGRMGESKESCRSVYPIAQISKVQWYLLWILCLAVCTRVCCLRACLLVFAHALNLFALANNLATTLTRCCFAKLLLSAISAIQNSTPRLQSMLLEVSTLCSGSSVGKEGHRFCFGRSDWIRLFAKAALTSAVASEQLA